MILRHVVRALVWAMAFMGIVAYLLLASHRLTDPLELDCIEGVMMDHVVRLAAGQPIYVEPSLHYIPLAYMPLFPTVSSLLARIWEPDLWQPRLVSLVMSLVVATLIGLVTWRETRRRTLSIAAAGLYCMGFAFNGACYDIARPDSLMLALTFGGLVVLRFTRGAAGAVAAALLISLGFFAKQHAVLFGLAALAHLVFHDRRRALPFGVAILLGCAGGFAMLTAWLGEYFRIFTWSIPRGWSQLSPVRIENYIGQSLFGAMGPLAVSVLMSLAAPARPRSERATLWYWIAGAAVGTGLMATLDPYAYTHVFAPTMAALCIAGPIALDRVARTFGGDEPSRHPGLAVTVLYVIMLVQFVPLLYPMHALQPRALSRDAHTALIRRLRELPGDVLIPYHGWYDRQSGRRSSMHIIAFDDIGRSVGNELLKRDPAYLDHMLAPLRSGPGRPTLVLDVRLEEMTRPWHALLPGYQLVDSLGWITEPLRPVTGNAFAPQFIYAPVEPPADTAATGQGSHAQP